MKYLSLLLLSFLIISCSNNKNSDEFVGQNSGRYLYNSDEVVEVYFTDNILFLKWRGASTIKPLKIDENLFFVKEMNQKIQFSINPKDSKNYMVLVPKESSDSIVYNYIKLEKDEKIPRELLELGEYEKALEAYVLIQKKDSLDRTINEGDFNRFGYDALRDKDYEKALAIFKINMTLHPESANVYDSYADGLKRKGDTLQAIEYYRKSLEIDSGNRRAKEFVKKYDKSE